MILKFIRKDILNEADAARGNRIKEIEKINSILEKPVELGGYSFVAKPKGFFILSEVDDGTLGRIKIQLDPEESDKCTIKVLNAAGTEIDDFSKLTDLNEFLEKLPEILSNISSQIIEKGDLKESLILEADFGKNSLLDKIKNYFDKKAAEKSNAETFKEILKSLKDKILEKIEENPILSTAEVKDSIKDNLIDISINVPYIVGADFTIDPKNITKIILNKVYNTVFPEGHTFNADINELFSILNKKLNLDIPTKVVDNTASSETENENSEDKENQDVENTDNKDAENTEGSDILTSPKDKEFKKLRADIRKNKEVDFKEFLSTMSNSNISKKKQQEILKAITDLYTKKSKT